MLLTPASVFAATGPFADELIFGDMEEATKRLASMAPLDAVRLILFSAHHADSVVGAKELENLADYLGVFSDEME